MKYGYARCSTNEDLQDVNRQVRELEAAGAELVISEYVHGDSDKKKQQQILMEKLQPGDTLIVTEVSRLCRSTRQLCDLIKEIEQKHLRLEVLNSITIDCTKGELDPMNKAFLQMAGVFSELELEMTRARIKSGMANAKAKGKPIGRPKKSAEDIPKQFIKLYALHKKGEMNISEVSKACGISRTTAYSYIDLLEGRK